MTVIILQSYGLIPNKETKQRKKTKITEGKLIPLYLISVILTSSCGTIQRMERISL